MYIYIYMYICVQRAHFCNFIDMYICNIYYSREIRIFWRIGIHICLYFFHVHVFVFKNSHMYISAYIIKYQYLYMYTYM